MKQNIKYYLGIICLSLSMINATIPSAENTLKQSNSPDMAATVLNPAKITFQEVVTGLANPIFITNAGDGSERLFILERSGKIRIVKNGALLPTPFLNIQSIVKTGGAEQGLLGLAFHPLYATNGEFFVFYTAPGSDSSGSNLILEKFSVSSGDPDLADPNSGEILLTVSHPGHPNHNGGTLAFGQDGYLYWSIGDGGGSGDPNNNAQNKEKYLGKILRLDVEAASPYIPNTNPFYSNTNPNIKKEIWAYGLRNPWRFSFDRLTHDLYIGDVGQSTWEEVNFQLAGSAGGQNYGWRVMEANRCNNPDSGCNMTGKVRPVAQYNHSDGRCSITGGYVYRGLNFPSLYGHYLYGDFCTGRLFTLYRNSAGGWDPVKSVDTPYNISTFGEDEQGELYLADYATGKIYNIGYQEPGPKLITPEQESFTNNTLPTFEWQAISSADHYEIVIASDEGFSSIVDTQDDVIGASFIPNISLTEGKYYWRVRGINSLNAAGTWSETRNFTIDTTPFAPPVLISPTDATTVTTSRPTFRWSAEKTAINYQIEVDDDPAFLSPELTATTKRKTLYQGPALPNGTYHWHVQVMDKAGNWSSWSPTFVITINH